ncbi:MAG: hypothetical protein JWN87_1184 [Frankiales bacterium]|jgi:hypothetical protein|nr:hypothetical protein [Frankiales bacterium]
MPGREETPEERADRNYNELLQELRVSETGVQVLFSLLLTVPFSQRFPQVTDYQRGVYFTALLFAAVASVLLIAPVSHHRLLFRRHQKPHLVRAASRFALAGQVMLWLAMTAVLLLVSDVLFGGLVAELFAAAFLVFTASIWFVPPLLRRLRAGPLEEERVRAADRQSR